MDVELRKCIGGGGALVEQLLIMEIEQLSIVGAMAIG